MKLVILIIVSLSLAVIPPALAKRRHWHSASATAYSTKENLTGCRYTNGSKHCYTACPSPWGELRDWQFTVATNPRLGLSCGQRLFVCYNKLCRRATVTDRTASRFDFEFSYALAIATGMPDGAGWDSPRIIKWAKE